MQIERETVITKSTGPDSNSSDDHLQRQKINELKNTVQILLKDNKSMMRKLNLLREHAESVCKQSE
jgi:chorismate-pyruvate lyase